MSFPMSRDEINAFVTEGRPLTDEEYNRLFAYYMANNLIPYGVAKARTGDPVQFITRDLQRMNAA